MILDYSEIEKNLRKFENKTKVLVGGCFDILHFGHLKFIQKAKELGDILIVALEPDEFIIQKKGRRPVHNVEQRAEILNSLKPVDVVIKLPLLKGYKDYLELTKKVRPQFIAATKGDPKRENKKKMAKELGAKYKEVIDLIRSFSTSSILSK